MAGLSYANPYTPETPVGAGLQNIAIALFANKRGDVKQQQGEMYGAHSDLYREQARKATVERQLAERLLRDQGPDAQDELIAAAAGVPSYTVRGFRDTMAGTNPGRTMEDYAAEAPGIRRGMLAVRPAYADKTINPVNIAQSLDQLGRTDTRNDVISGKLDAKKAAQGFFATSGHAPYQAGETGATDLTSGVQTLNPIGVQRAAREGAHARDYNARAAQTEEETRTGVKIGGPEIIDSEAGPVFAPRRAAIGQRPGLDPNKARAPGVGGGRNGDGSTTTTDLKLLKASDKDMSLLRGGIDRAVGGQLADPISEGAVLERAQKYFSTPGSPHYGQHEAAARAALMDLAPDEGFESSWIGNKFSPKGGGTWKTPGDISLTAPRTSSRTKGPNSTPGGAATGRPQQPAAAGAGGHPARPAGKSDQQLIEEANKAIQAGRDRNVIMQRLQAWGVQLG